MRTRNIKIQCWLSEKEYAAFDKAVKKSPLSKSCYIRKLILGYAPIEAPTKVFFDTQHKLYEACDALKYIADNLYSQGFDAGDYDKAYRELCDVTQEIFMEVTKTPKLKELKVDDEDEEKTCAIQCE